MITRHHTANGTTSSAVYSDCEHYRYALTRVWDENGPRVTFVMLNPSKATETQNDPTVERCERRARALGYGAFCVTNIFAWRETDPTIMRKTADPIGPDNDLAIQTAQDWADHTVAAWGTHGAHLGRGAAVEQVLRQTDKPVFTLGLTKHGAPRHPLYVAYAQPLILWADPNRH